MNEKQVAYQVGRVINNYYDVIYLAIAIKCGCVSVDTFLNSQVALGITSGVLSLYAGFEGFIGGGARVLNHLDLKRINAERESCPLEHAERVVIDDVKGLEFLLSKTNDREKQEWGTLLKAYDDKGRAVVYDVLEISIGKELGLIGKGTRTTMRFESTRADREGYKGCHHYHPPGIRTMGLGPRWFGPMNFSIGLNDRFNPVDWINLLTFNLPEGPEIVGFNRQHIYIFQQTILEENL